MGSTQAASQFVGETIIAFLAYRLLIVFVEFGLLVEFCVANGAGEVMDTPGLVQSRKNIASYDLVADET